MVGWSRAHGIKVIISFIDNWAPVDSKMAVRLSSPPATAQETADRRQQLAVTAASLRSKRSERPLRDVLLEPSLTVSGALVDSEIRCRLPQIVCPGATPLAQAATETRPTSTCPPSVEFCVLFVRRSCGQPATPSARR